MNQGTTVHLQYDELLKAMVDTTDLADETRAHLETCPGCQGELSRLDQRFNRIGQMARSMAPEPSQAFRVPAHHEKAANRRFKPVLAMGMIAAMVLMFTIFWPQQYKTVEEAAPVAVQDGGMEDLLMDEIDSLVADAMPAMYREMAAVVESPSLDDLIEWIVPSIEEENDFDPRA